MKNSNTEQINIVLAPDNNYAQHAAVVMASVLIHNKDKINFWILDGGLTEENKSKLSKFVNLKNYKVNFLEINPDDFKDFPESGYITRAMWYRLKIGSLLPIEVEKCLYLDCDTIVNSDLRKLFSMQMNEKCAAASIDCVYNKFVKKNKKYFSKNYEYFNSGVLLLNLKQWRNQKIENEILEFIKKNPHTLKLFDQTILNIILQNRVLDFGISYNFQFTPKFLGETSYWIRKKEYTEAAKSPKIIHFVGEFKPWEKGYNAQNPNYKLYFEALRLTEWKLTREKEIFILKESDKDKCKIFRTLLKKNLKRKPWYIFRKRFWQRIFL